MYGIYEDGNVLARFTTPLSVKSNKPVLTADALSLKRFNATSTAQRWEIEGGLEPLSLNANVLMAHLVRKGSTETVNVVMPQNYGAVVARVGGTSGSSQATGYKGGTSVSVVNNAAGSIPIGTFVQFSGHPKLYMTTSARQGNGNMGVYPALVDDVASSFTWEDDVIGNFYYDTEVAKGMVYQDGILMDVGIVRLVEKL